MKKALLAATLAILVVLLAVRTLSTGPRVGISPEDELDDGADADQPPKSGQAGRAFSGRPRTTLAEAHLRAEVARLRMQVEEESVSKRKRCLTGTDRDCSFLSPPREDLAEMARCGVVRIDLPDTSPLGLARIPDEERPVVTMLWTEVSDRLRAELQVVARELGEGQVAAGDSLDQVFADVESRIAGPVTDGILKKIAEERLGSARVASRPGQSASERFWRLRVSAGDLYEEALGKRLGADRARALRRETDGWRLKSVYWVGCPDAGAVAGN